MDAPKSFSIDDVVTGPIEPVRLAMPFDRRRCRAAGKANLAVEGAKYTVHQNSGRVKVHVRHQGMKLLPTMRLTMACSGRQRVDGGLQKASKVWALTCFVRLQRLKWNAVFR
jgi:hypothetical protein